jgi:hypothetical protein
MAFHFSMCESEMRMPKTIELSRTQACEMRFIRYAKAAEKSAILQMKIQETN